MEGKVKVWVRVGMTLEVSREDFNTMLTDSVKGATIITNAIKQGDAKPDGDTYIPENVIANLNKFIGTDYEVADYEYWL